VKSTEGEKSNPHIDELKEDNSQNISQQNNTGGTRHKKSDASYEKDLLV